MRGVTAMALTTINRQKVSVSTMGTVVFDTIAGQERTREVQSVRPAAGAAKVALPGDWELGEITVTAILDPARHAAIRANLMAGRTAAYDGATITLQDIDTSGNAIPGAKITYTGCVVSKSALDDADANGSEVSKMSITFQPGSIA